MAVAAESCLQNSIIIQKILKHISSDSIENLRLRLLNSSFNSEVIRRIRTAHRDMLLDVPGAHYFRVDNTSSEPLEIKEIKVNECREVKADAICDYIRFLREVANVKVNKLFMRNFWAAVSCEKWRKSLHDEIHRLLENQTLRRFIGMSDLCTGVCTNCYNCASNSLEYGPLGIDLLLRTHQKPLHFQKLTIDDRRLHGIASNIFMYVPADNLKKFVKYYVDPLITCDQLCFKISEFIHPSAVRSEPLPLEIIEEMCDVWKAKSVVIEYDYYPQNGTEKETWSDKGTFTPFRFDELYQESDKRSDKKKRKYSSVTIDMMYTQLIYGEFINGSIEEDDSFSNLISNVRRVFPTDKIVIISQLLPNPDSRLYFTRTSFENILNSVWKNPGHLEVTIKHHARFIFLSHNFVIPDSIDILGHELTCTLLPERLTSVGKFIGRRFRITDQSCEKILNLELFLTTSSLKRMVKEAEIRGITHLKNGFLSLFSSDLFDLAWN